jgi:hypothetical protein
VLETRHRLKTRKKGRVKVERGQVIISAHVSWGWGTVLQCLTGVEMRVSVPLPVGAVIAVARWFSTVQENIFHNWVPSKPTSYWFVYVGIILTIGGIL